MKDFMTFRRMITPFLVQVLFWVGVVGCISAGVFVIITKGAIVGGLVRIIVLPLLLRIAAEIILLLFRIYETLLTMRCNT